MISLKPLLKLKEIYCWFNFFAFHLARLRWNFCLASSGIEWAFKKNKAIWCIIVLCRLLLLDVLRRQTCDLRFIATSKASVCIKSTFRLYWKLFFLFYPLSLFQWKIYPFCASRSWDPMIPVSYPWLHGQASVLPNTSTPVFFTLLNLIFWCLTVLARAGAGCSPWSLCVC